MGSNPLVASSSNSSWALWESATAMASFIFIPREKSLIVFLAGNSNCSRYCAYFAGSHCRYRERIIFPTSCAQSISGRFIVSKTTPIFSFTSSSFWMLSFPKIWISPSSRRIRFKIAFIVVDFPAPFSPIKPIIQPRGSVKETWSSAKSSYFLHRPLTCKMVSIYRSSW